MSSCGGSVQYHPTDASVMISFTGCLIVISDVKDPHQQEFLRGHNEAITCMAISPSGALIAFGGSIPCRPVWFLRHPPCSARAGRLDLAPRYG